VRLTSLGLVLTLLLSVAGPSLGGAQEAHVQQAGEAVARPAGAQVLTDPVSGERYVEVRPTQVIERGRWAVPSWLVWGLAAVVTLTGAGVLVRRLTRARRGH